MTPPEPAPACLPRRRGANLLALPKPVPRRSPEEEFARLAGWGFDAARPPLCWRTWSSPARWHEADPTALG